MTPFLIKTQYLGSLEVVQEIVIFNQMEEISVGNKVWISLAEGKTSRTKGCFMHVFKGMHVMGSKVMYMVVELNHLFEVKAPILIKNE